MSQAEELDVDRLLPTTWRTAPLREVAEIVAGVGFPLVMQGRSMGAIPFFKVGDISRAWLASRPHLTRAEHYITPEECQALRATPLPAGTVVFAKIGAAIALNRRALLAQPSLVDNNVFGVIPTAVSSHYLFYWLCTVHFGKDSRATTVPSLRRDDVGLKTIPLPPVAEQQRIVAGIEKQFTRLDEVVATLQAVKAKLKRARASVLKAATEGRLVPTEAELARAEGRSYQPASVLIRRLHDERHSPGLPSEGLDLVASPSEPAERPPDGWSWATLGELGCVVGGITKNSQRMSLERQVPYLRVANVYANELRLDEVKTIGVRDDELERYLLRAHDLLVVEGNGSLDQIGRAAVWDGRIDPCIHQNHLIRVRPAAPWLSKWGLWWMLSPTGRRLVERVSSSTSGLHTLSLSKVAQIPVRVPPEKECTRIVAEVERRLSVLDALDKAVDENLARCDRLRQSILKRAFEGKLMPQDPRDEPASVSLDRMPSRLARGGIGASSKAARRTRTAS